MDRQTILVIDDDKDVRDLAIDLLSKEYNIITASNGFDGVQIYKKSKNPIDLVLLDLRMAGMDGHDVFTELLDFSSRVRVVIFTGHSDKIDTNKMLRMGAVGLIKKPAPCAQIQAAVKDGLNAELLYATPF